jgi:hypothetical protein
LWPADVLTGVEHDADLVALLPDGPACEHSAAAGNEQAHQVVGTEMRARRQAQPTAGGAEVLDDASDRRRQSLAIERGDAVAGMTRFAAPVKAMHRRMAQAVEQIGQRGIAGGRPEHQEMAL